MILMTILIMNVGGKTGRIVPPQNKNNTVTEDSNKPMYLFYLIKTSVTCFISY